MGAIPLHDAELVDAPAQLPPGDYQAYYKRHNTAYFQRSAKVYVHFQIHGGEHHGANVYRAYRVKELRGKPRKNGAFKLRHTQELYRQFVRLAGNADRPDRISLQRLRGCLLRVSVRTVVMDYKQRALPEALQYAVVDELLAVEAGHI